MITNRILLKLIILILVSGFIFSGCGWEDDVSGGDVKVIKYVSATSSKIAVKNSGSAQTPESTELSFQATDTNGNPAKNVKISFSLSSDGISNGVTIPAEATSDNNGFVVITASSGDKVGKFSVTAAYKEIKINSEEITITNNIGSIKYISSTVAKIGVQSSINSQLPKSTKIAFQITDAKGIPVKNAKINFLMSADGTLNEVTFSPTEARSDDKGIVEVTATSGNKTGTFSVKAYADEINADSDVISVVDIRLKAISFMSATPSRIIVKGSGSNDLPEFSKISFKVTDNEDKPYANTVISLNISQEGIDNGVSFSDKEPVSVTEAKSDADGLIEVRAYSGGKAGRFEVTAKSKDDNSIFKSSDIVTIITKNDLVSSILFTSTTNSTLAIKDHGSELIPETTEIRFRLVDSTNKSVSGATAKLSLSTDTGGITLSSSTAISDGNGEIKVIAKTGTSITDFKVIASLDGNDSIKAETTPIAITSNTGMAINFVSANPKLIALKGTGGADLSETSALKFKVVDESGKPVPGLKINFELSTKNGGIGLGITSGKSDTNGEIIVNVTSGTIPTSVTVIASLDTNAEVRAISAPIAISTGRPSVNHFTVGPNGFHAVGAWDENGIEKVVSVIATDRYFHPVPDGTAVAFRTEWGLIDPVCYTQNGGCKVTWKSNGERAYFTDVNKQEPPGRITIMASVNNGEENFVDVNANGIFDAIDNESWNSAVDEQTEASVETRESILPFSKFPGDNGLKWEGYKPTDEFLDDNDNGEWNEGNKKYNGELCSDAAETAGICSKDLVRVWASSVIIATPTKPVSSCEVKVYNHDTGTLAYDPVTGIGGIDLTGVASKQYVLEVKDSLGHSLPGDTLITFAGFNDKGEEVKLSFSEDKIPISETASIGFGATLFNFSVLRTPTKKSKISVQIAGSAGERKINIPVTEPEL